MKIAAIVSEYNPFHNGHAFQLNETRRITGCDYVVAVMSGSFTQRGEPAICDKWSRTAAALRNGVDAVFEIPCDFAMASAEYFAWGGAGTAGLLGCDFLSFGAESPVEVLSGYADFMRSDDFNVKIRAGLESGLSYPRALASATGTGRILPNDILGIQYIKTIKENGFDMIPVAVPRCGAAHNADGEGALPDGKKCMSAGGLRRLAAEKDFPERIREYVPDGTYDETVKWASAERFKTLSDFDGIVSAFLRSGLCDASAAQFSTDANDGGLYSLIRKTSAKYNKISDIAEQCTSKYFTRTRINRCIMKIITGGNLNPCKELYYARLLGFRKESSECIRELKKRSRVPVVDFPAKYIKNPENREGAEMLRRDIRAQAVYNSVLVSREKSDADRDYTEGTVIL